MKTFFKKSIALTLTLLMLITSIPVMNLAGVDLGFTAEAVTYQVGDIIQFGSYPQSEVKDKTLIRKLNTLVPDWENWVNYGYYESNEDNNTNDHICNIKTYTMRYTDIVYGKEKYRAVKFTDWRYTKNTSGVQSNNGYSCNMIYWFKFEPINWKILDVDDGLCISDTIVDAQCYNNALYRTRGGTYGWFNDSSYSNYACDYVSSSIRSWLNNTFYNSAFSSREKKMIKTSELNNDCSATLLGISGYSAFDSDPTKDNIFLLSFEDANNIKYGFSSDYTATDEKRTSKSSNYAKIQGLSVNKNEYEGQSGWLLRSPGYYSYCCSIVTASGKVHGVEGGFPHPATDVVYGIRPALRLNLDPEGNNTDTSIVFESGNNYYIYTGSMDLLKNGEYGFYSTDLYAKLYSDELTSDDVEWACSDETILKIIRSGGYYDYERKHYNLSLLVEGLKPGTVTLTAIASDGTTENCTITVIGTNSYFKVESVNSTNSIPVDASIPLYVSLFKNGIQTSTKKIYSLSFDNPGIFEVESATTRSNVHGAFFDLVLKAKKEGVTNLTISDSDTGAYVTVKLTAYRKMNVYYFDNVPSKEYQKDRLTNFYNYNGLCIDGFYYTEYNGTSNNYYYVNMNAYNAKHHYGVAVSYDKNGKIHDFEILEPFKEYKTTFIENIAEAYYSVCDTAKLFGDKYYYTGDSISKYTHVYLEVPKDGYVIVTNNCGENELAYLVNMIEYSINIALSIASASIGMVEKGELVKELSENIVKDLIELGLTQTIQAYASSLSKNFSYKNINNNISEFSEAMKKLDLDIVKIVTDAINLEFGISVAESAFWNILPTGKIIEMMMAFNDACNAVLHADNFAKSYDAPQIILYPPLNNDDVYESNGVIVNPEKELSPDYVLHSYVVAKNNQVAVEADKVLDGVSDQYKIYNITLYKGGKETQPNGKIKVMIPIPVGYDKKMVVVYWYKEDGTLISIDAKVKGDYAVFYTEHLSYYVLAEKQHIHSFGDEDEKCECGFDRTEDCSCRCHKKGFMGFIWKIIRFFWKLFKMNSVCECGVSHY